MIAATMSDPNWLHKWKQTIKNFQDIIVWRILVSYIMSYFAKKGCISHWTKNKIYAVFLHEYMHVFVLHVIYKFSYHVLHNKCRHHKHYFRGNNFLSWKRTHHQEGCRFSFVLNIGFFVPSTSIAFFLCVVQKELIWKTVGSFWRLLKIFSELCTNNNYTQILL